MFVSQQQGPPSEFLTPHKPRSKAKKRNSHVQRGASDRKQKTHQGKTKKRREKKSNKAADGDTLVSGCLSSGIIIKEKRDIKKKHQRRSGLGSRRRYRYEPTCGAPWPFIPVPSRPGLRLMLVVRFSIAVWLIEYGLVAPFRSSPGLSAPFPLPSANRRAGPGAGDGGAANRELIAGELWRRRRGSADDVRDAGSAPGDE